MKTWNFVFLNWSVYSNAKWKNICFIISARVENQSRTVKSLTPWIFLRILEVNEAFKNPFARLSFLQYFHFRSSPGDSETTKIDLAQ